LVVFDSAGKVRYVEESVHTHDRRFTVAHLFLVDFDTTSIGEPFVIRDETPGKLRGL
jgi:hypothetical protein